MLAASQQIIHVFEFAIPCLPDTQIAGEGIKQFNNLFNDMLLIMQHFILKEGVH